MLGCNIIPSNFQDGLDATWLHPFQATSQTLDSQGASVEWKRCGASCSALVAVAACPADNIFDVAKGTR
jgi:hypothetical protein